MTYREESTKDVAERLSIAELVAVYENTEAEIRASFATISAATDRLTALFSGKFDVRLKGGHGQFAEIARIDFKEPDTTIAELRRDIWGALIDRSQVRRAMSIAAWDALQSKIRNDVPPPINADTLQGLIDQFKRDTPAMLEAAVHEVFNLLRPPGSRFKTNTEFELGERVILSRYIEPQWTGGRWRVAYGCEQNLIALENVFAMVAGELPRDKGSPYSDLSLAIQKPQGACIGETALCSFKGHKNGTLHLRFKRMDLVQKLNVIAGGNRLKPTQEVAE